MQRINLCSTKIYHKVILFSSMSSFDTLSATLALLPCDSLKTQALQQAVISAVSQEQLSIILNHYQFDDGRLVALEILVPYLFSLSLSDVTLLLRCFTFDTNRLTALKALYSKLDLQGATTQDYSVLMDCFEFELSRIECISALQLYTPYPQASRAQLEASKKSLELNKIQPSSEDASTGIAPSDMSQSSVPVPSYSHNTQISMPELLSLLASWGTDEEKLLYLEQIHKDVDISNAEEYCDALSNIFSSKSASRSVITLLGISSAESSISGNKKGRLCIAGKEYTKNYVRRHNPLTLMDGVWTITVTLVRGAYTIEISQNGQIHTRYGGISTTSTIEINGNDIVIN